MVATLNSNTELMAEKAENYSFCKGIKLIAIRDNVKELLSYIGRNNIFDEYTLHNIQHIDEMLRITDWIIPSDTRDHMTHAEWLMLTLAIYFHDLGMLVTKEEYENRLNTDFKSFRERELKKADPATLKILSEDDHFLYQEFVRENHATRISDWILDKNSNKFGCASRTVSEIQSMLSNLTPKFKRDLALVCQSHHEDDIDDFQKYKIRASYGNDPQEEVNINYIAILLRITDLLHITNDRTPSLSMRVLNIRNPKSIIEWQKQRAVQSIKPQSRRNEDGNIDDSLEKDTIEVAAYFEGADYAEAYFGLSSYLKYTQTELVKCHSIVEKAAKTEGATNYRFPWVRIDESNIETIGFETKKLQFVLEQESILQLLVGHTLYNDSSVVVRELVQNSIDAVKLQKEIDRQESKAITDGKIIVSWDENKRHLNFTDNGTGMSISDIENYLLKVGASKYKGPEIKKRFPDFVSISHFGIGILTCFMIADEIEITTNAVEQEEANIVSLRNVNGSYLLKKVDKSTIPSLIQLHGTSITLHIRSDVNMDHLEDDLKKWIVFPDVPVYLKTSCPDSKIPIGHDSLRAPLKSYLETLGINVDDKNIKIFEEKCGNVSVAFAVKYNKYLSDWSLITLRSLPHPPSSELCMPIGTCIEGIRVEFNTPGYKDQNILAIANIKNSSYQTNVARSAIEYDANMSFLEDIYTIYVNYLQGQMKDLCSSNFSESWAINECQYLMYPLLHEENYHNTETEPVNKDVLMKCIAKAKCLIVEKNGKRISSSADEVDSLETINIFEGKIFYAIQSLFNELPSDSSLNEVIKTVYGTPEYLSGVENILCNYQPSNITHKYALRNKEVSYIKIDREQRIIQLSLSTTESRWKKYELENETYSGPRPIVFISNNEFPIEGLDDEVGVRAIGCVFLNGSTDLAKYLTNTINTFSDLPNNDLLTDLLLSFVFQSGVLELSTPSDDTSHILGRFNRNHDSERYSGLWDVLKPDEFANEVLAKKHTLYSIHNWSRRSINGFY